MSKIFIIFFSIFSQYIFAQDTFMIDPQVTNKVPFISKIGDDKNYYGTYLQMNINFAPVKELFLKLDHTLKGSLNKKNARVEAHITVLTPIEYQKFFKPLGILMDEINQIALDMKIQNSDVTYICVGKGENVEQSQQTYYIVVKSRNLSQIRNQLFYLYKKRGGIPSQFDPNNFYPHITIGYTNSDLHLSNGVYKGRNSCWGSLRISSIH